METIWSILSVFGLVSLLLLVVGIWTHLDMQKQKQDDERQLDEQRNAKLRH